MRNVCLIILAATFIALASAQPASAIIQFYNVYAKEHLDTHPDKDYAAAVKKPAVRCLVCHQGKKRTNHNAFGIHLVEMLDKKKDMKDVAKISESINKALALHVDPKNESSETYADRVKASKWPGGELEDLKKEPPKEEEGQTAAN